METVITCPKCSAEMVSVRRSGVLIDRCSDCSGIFLDRGELEKIVAMEQPSSRNWDDDDDDRDYDDDDRERGHGRRKKSRKRSFFEELLDIG